MTTMFVYFDNNGDIKSISPEIETSLETVYKSAKFSINEVEDFLIGKKNPSDYYIKSNKTEHKIIKKRLTEVVLLRTLDNYLTEIRQNNKQYILIENFIKDKKIKISINPVIKDLFYEDNETEKIQQFINNSISSLFFTKNGDPYFLIKTILFSPKQLFENNEIYYTYAEDLSNSSLYTRKIIDGYSYIIRR